MSPEAAFLLKGVILAVAWSLILRIPAALDMVGNGEACPFERKDRENAVVCIANENR